MCAVSVSALVGLGEWMVSDLSVWATGKGLEKFVDRFTGDSGTLSHTPPPHPASPPLDLFATPFLKHKFKQIRTGLTPASGRS